uniref:Uncharacterized protein n=1 Tax=Anguilla anguilla TaxID=7936 RepID=A0A0E9V7V8_ANGAN
MSHICVLAANANVLHFCTSLWIRASVC